MPRHKKNRLFFWCANTACSGAVALVVLLVLLTSARWSGSFILRVDVKSPSNIDRESFLYLECRDQQIASWLCERDNPVSEGFAPPFQRDANSDFVVVPTGGESSALRLFDTYHQPDAFILQYDQVSDNGERNTSRVCVPIPEGRGERSTSIDLMP